GTGLSGLAALATGSDPQPVTGILSAIIISAPARALFWLAIGGGRLSRASAGPAARKAPAGASRTDSDALEPERNSVLDIVIGGLVHFGFAARAAFRRARSTIEERRQA